MVESTSLSQKLSALLQQQILFAEICPGHKLKSQRDLADQYQLSRSTVREAVQDLELKGLIETQQGAVVGVKTSLSNILPCHLKG